MRAVVNAIAGLLFGLGLLISGMANPAKVQNFLDLAGTFDPSLIFVMLGAVVVTFVGYRLVFRRPRPLLAERFFVPTVKDIDGRLTIGAALFGIGWGLSGFCPGPAITSLPLLAKGTLIFVPCDVGRHRLGASPYASEGTCRRGGSHRVTRGLASLGLPTAKAESGRRSYGVGLDSSCDDSLREGLATDCRSRRYGCVLCGG
jgi:hypothetical protein